MKLKTGNRKGQTSVMFTLALVPLMGVLGLVVDIGWAYYRYQAAQTAADAAAAAAGAAAYDWAGGSPTCAMTHIFCSPTSDYVCPASPSTTPNDNGTTACLYAKENGFTTGGNQSVVVRAGVGSAPTAAGVTMAYWVSVRVTETLPQLFSRVLGFPTATVSVRATTGTRQASSGGCVITLNPSLPGSMQVNGAASLTSGCGVFVNSNSPQALDTNGGGLVSTTGTARTQIVGNCTGGCNVSPSPQTGAAQMTDPFSDLAPPTYGSCTNTGISLGSHQRRTIDPGVYCGSGWDLGSQSELDLNPGVYVLDVTSTTFAINMTGQASLVGSGVTIYLKHGGVNMSGGTSVALTAPTAGQWQGILFYEDRNNTSEADLTGGSGELMNGVLYFPSAHLRYTGGSSTSATATTIVADTLTMVGNSFISAAASTSFTGTTGGIFLIE